MATWDDSGWRIHGLYWEPGEEPDPEVVRSLQVVGGYLINPPPWPSSRRTRRLPLSHNALQVLEALYRHGSHPVYADPEGGLAMYSEHAGVLTVHEGRINEVITTTHAYRIDANDRQIYLPQNTPTMLQHPYLFHTHPLVDEYGGRRGIGIIYELPSPGDIYNYVYHSVHGRAQASLVLAPEGLYVVRKLVPDLPCQLSERDLRRIQTTLVEVEEAAMQRVTDLDLRDPDTFHRRVGRDTRTIRAYNRVLRPLNLWAEYYPRLCEGGQAVIPTIDLWYYD